ncbi:Zn(2)-Cys(6) binuclear cluster domain-containing protein [Mycena vulgaris]|nr:Zn(2)-Cys(6) binuclear cluster domain-containing protein [Mycena vulgaris]
MASTSRASPDSGKLQRGQACFNCRRRKRKCDGNLPCSQCTRLDIEDDCEYTDGARRTTVATILQEDISRLQSRINDLENSHQPKFQRHAPLHQPYHASTSKLDPACIRPTQSGIPAGEPPLDMVQPLIDNFLAYSSEFGFFLNPERFRQSALMPYQTGHHARPSPALLSTVYLWGLRLSNQPNWMAQEPVFLARAVNLISKGLSDTHPQRVLHTLQAEILLSYFFFASGRVLEGKYHTAAAISLSLSSSLHLIRSENHPTAAILQPPVDVVEEGERIYAWWTVMILDNCWAVGLNEKPGFAHLAIVDTPWPLEIDDYPKGRLMPTARYSQTMHKFATDTPTPETGMSTLAMLAKATYLWQRADEVARTWKADMSPEQIFSFQSSFTHLDTLIDRFREALVPPNGISKPTPAMTRTLVVAHSITHSATVRLQSVFANTDLLAKRKRLAAARSVLGIIAAVPLRHFRYINPIMGTVWVTACSVFLDEICALKAQRTSSPREEETNLRAFLSRAGVAISAFESTCPLLRSQISPLRESCARIGINI